MVQTRLTGGSADHFIAAKVDGAPIGRYAAQLITLLRQRGLADLADCLAIPVYGQDQIQWYYQGQVRQNISWREASTKQQFSCVEKLLKMAHSVNLLQERLKHLSLPSSSIIDQVLRNLTVIPSTDAICIINQQPVILFWGYYSADRQKLDLKKLHAHLNQQIIASENISNDESLTNVAAAKISLPQKSWTPVKKIMLTTLSFIVIATALTSYLFFSTSSPATEIPVTPQSSVVSPVERELTHLAATVVRLPLVRASYNAPPPPRCYRITEN